MTEQNRWDDAITEAVNTSFSTVQALEPSALGRILRSKTAGLRKYYLQAGANSKHLPHEEWLCDNYYVLEKESKQTVKDLRQLSKRAVPGELGQLYAVLRHVLSTLRPDICDETVTALVRAVSGHMAVSELQFAFLPAGVKAALVELAHTACREQDAVGMGYAVTGLIRLGAVDMDSIIQHCSTVEAVLQQDPAGVYPAMSTASKHYYRHLIAKIAAKTHQGEEQVALQMLHECTAAGDRHIGQPILSSPYITGPRRRRGKAALLAGVALPLLCCVLLGLLCHSFWVAVLSFLPLWEIFRTVVQHVAMAGAEVDFIPRMSLKKVKDKPKTVVLVSTLLPKAGEAAALRSRLEQLYFSNSDPDMYYCILADLAEWRFPTDEKDESQIAAARKVIEALNRKHGQRFMLFLRARTYNKTQNKYSGWERKRGAITEFIRFLKGEKTSLHTFVGDRAVLPQIKFAIALDGDTSLLYESAQTLVSAAIHPLNRPVSGPEGVVTAGYGILVPKISADLESARQTAFSRVMTGLGGVTAYDTKDKDFYQDLFAEGIFAGKGLIDVDCFYSLLNDRFPENQVLSHDILEGAYLRVGFVSDAEMADGTPRSMQSWLARLHRWLRGDWQNLKFTAQRYKGVDGRLYDNPIGTLSKYKLFDNLRRSLTPVAALLCVLSALVLPPLPALVLVVCGVLSVTFASIWAAVFALLTGGMFTLSRKFFTRTLPHTLELLAQGALMLVMMPVQALVTADAAARSLWRTFLSHKNMLEWQTAAQSDSRANTFGAAFRRFWLAELLGVLYFIAAFPTGLCLLGAVFALVLPVAWLSARPWDEEGHALSGAQRDKLISYNAAMWRYYEDYANKENNWLPPDNIQQSPVFRVANRTSPTNIGMLLLSVLAARDFDFIDTPGLYRRIDRTIATVEDLPKWHGNLYNWYDTVTLDTLKPEFISTVDSGNFICCLVALAQGLREFVPEMPAFTELISRVEAIIESTDLTVFYNKKKHLFSIGYDMDAGELVGSHYDFLMSEARLTSYYAVARKTVGKRHWGALVRTMSRNGSYAGPVSWTGTMFEYFMPHLLLPVYEGSLLSESLVYCLYCHKRRVRGLDVPWGISESAFYAFDNNLNYQYKAHGVQKLGVKRALDKELVISPYSTFLTIPMNPNSSMENLDRLHRLGVYGRYGFFEAVDFTADRVGAGALAVTRSYMAHHIGMSMVASCNAVFDGRMQKRFMRDNYMRSAKEFLQEKIAKNTVVYDDLTAAGDKGEKHERPKVQRDGHAAIYPQNPKCAAITNGEITDILTDTGAGYLKFGDIDLTRRSTDLLRRSQGLMALVRLGGRTASATAAPYFDPSVNYSVEYQEQAVTYFAKTKEMELGMRCMMHPTISCEQRQLAVKNTTSQKQLAQVLMYFEPVLCSDRDYSAHPAYSKLFVQAAYDKDSRTLTFSRRNRDSTVDMYLTVGFLQDIDFSFETRREALMSAPKGLEDLLHFADKPFSGNGGGVPDACCALKFDLLLNPGAQGQATLLLCAARTQSEGIAGIISMRSIGMLDEKNAAKSPLLGDSLEGRLGCALLGQLLYNQADSAADPAAREQNRQGQSALWSTGISGDLPIALLELGDEMDEAVLAGYLRLHRTLRGLQVEFDLCILYDGQDKEALRARILSLVEKSSVGGILGSRGGVFVLERGVLSPELYTLLRAVARHITTGALPSSSPVPGIPFRPVQTAPVSPEPMPDSPETPVEGGAFHQGRFYVDKNSPLPWSHVLANPVFGTLVSDSALGYTWAVNSRENKLTPWYNDICTDNTGEMLLLYDGESYLNLVDGARASFAPDDAVYQGRSAAFSSQVRVTVSAKGCAKFIDLTLTNRGKKARTVQCAYYTEPVLGVTRETARYIRPEITPDGQTLALQNPYNTAVHCAAAITAKGSFGELGFLTDRAAFLSGDWSAGRVRPQDDPCAAAILHLDLPPDNPVQVRFVLAWAQSPAAAVKMAALDLRPLDYRPANSIQIKTPNAGINQYVNHFAAHQILASRIWGRTAFYQCGGAYGFRDQLQDVCAFLLLDPELARRHIIRCCGVQFEEGDVLHWWHPLPRSGGGLRGVRTKFSDDLLFLPLAVAEYAAKTGDNSLLRVKARYLAAPELGSHEHEKYIAPAPSHLVEPVYAHCIRALERAWNLDERGLPLIGCGDWCDGFSSVGLKGKGGSVWLAMFQAMVLDRFAPLCQAQGDSGRAALYRRRAADLRAACDAHGWDGSWYLRAFFDDGEPMGSHRNEECAIDLLPQSFAVFCDMPDKARVDKGLESALDRLVDEKHRLIRLFHPPFQHSHQKPGYVKAYPGGIRENGGQYTHAAVWFAMALMEAGKADDGARLLSMLCPADRGMIPQLARSYLLEPYYIAADIYSSATVPGRGGWSLYTGAASWYYRAVLETLLGIRLEGKRVRFAPHLPTDWPRVSLELVLSGTQLNVTMAPGIHPGVVCDGKPVESVPLDGELHMVEVTVIPGK